MATVSRQEMLKQAEEYIQRQKNAYPDVSNAIDTTLQIGQDVGNNLVNQATNVGSAAADAQNTFEQQQMLNQAQIQGGQLPQLNQDPYQNVQLPEGVSPSQMEYVKGMSAPEVMAVGAGSEFDKVLNTGLPNLMDMPFSVGNADIRNQMQERTAAQEQRDQLVSPLDQERSGLMFAGRSLPYVAPTMAAKPLTTMMGRFLPKPTGAFNTAVTDAANKIPGVMESRPVLANLREKINPNYKFQGRKTLSTYAGKMLDSNLARDIGYGTAISAVHPDISPEAGAIGGILGGFASESAASFLSRPEGKMNPTEKYVNNWARQKGLYRTPGFKSGNPREQMLAHAFETDMHTASQFKNRILENKDIETAMIGNLFGEKNLRDLGPSTMNRIKDGLKQQYSNLSAQSNAVITPRQLKQLHNIRRNMSGLGLDQNDMAIINNVMRPLSGQKTGGIVLSSGEAGLPPSNGLPIFEGDAYQNMRQNIKIAILDANKNGKKALANQLGKIKKVLAGSLDNPKLARAWDSLDEKYALLNEFVPQVVPGGTGDIEGGNIAQYLRYSDPERFIMTDPQKLNISAPEGMADLYNWARYNHMLSSQTGKSLGASQAVRNFLNPSKTKESLSNLYMNELTAKIPWYKNMLAGMYLSDFPGRLKMPAGSPKYFGKLGRRAGAVNFGEKYGDSVDRQVKDIKDNVISPFLLELLLSGKR